VKVLLYGESASPGSGAWCYAETLREMGHEVIAFDDQHHLDAYRGFGWRVARKLANGPIEPHRRRHIAALVETVTRTRPEIVIVLKGLLLGPDDVRALRALAWTVNINHDDFFSGNRNNWTPRQRAAIGEWDFVFTTRRVNVGEVRPLNPRVEFFPFAYFPRIHRPVAISDGERERYQVDAVFVGTWERERAALLEQLVARVPGRYAIWGTQWDKVARSSPLRPHLRSGPIVLDEMAKALGGARVALAFLRKENRDDYTQRTFEIPACGGLLLGERTEEHKRLFTEGVEAEFFDPNSPDELCDKLRALNADEPRSEAMRRAGREALLRQHHTYRDRLERLLALYASR
jgi:hypothetical protein